MATKCRDADCETDNARQLFPLGLSLNPDAVHLRSAVPAQGRTEALSVSTVSKSAPICKRDCRNLFIHESNLHGHFHLVSFCFMASAGVD